MLTTVMTRSKLRNKILKTKSQECKQANKEILVLKWFEKKRQITLITSMEEI